MTIDREDLAGGVKPGRPGPETRTLLLVVVAVILGGWALRAMAVVAVPLVAALLIALAVMPVRDWVRARVPERLGWLGHVAAMSLILLVLSLFFGGIWFAAQRVVGEFSDQAGPILETLREGPAEGEQPVEGELTEGAVAGAENAPSARDGEEGEMRLPGTVGEVLRMLGSRATGAATGVATAILNSAMGLVAGLVLVFFFTLLMLMESGEWRRKLRAVAAPRTEWQLSESAEVIAGKVRAYLLTQGGLGAASAALYFGWLSVWGVDLRIVWVLLIFLLNFIPNIGSLVGGTLPVAFTLLTQGPGPALGVGAGVMVIEQVMGNFIAPRLQSRTISLSPLVVLVALVVWGWIWGIAGAFLAVPVTVALVVFGAHVPALRPWALLLSDRTTLGGLDEATRPE